MIGAIGTTRATRPSAARRVTRRGRGDVGTFVVQHDAVVGPAGRDEVRGAQPSLVRGADASRARRPRFWVGTVRIERTYHRDRDHLTR